MPRSFLIKKKAEKREKRLLQFNESHHQSQPAPDIPLLMPEVHRSPSPRQGMLPPSPPSLGRYGFAPYPDPHHHFSALHGLPLMARPPTLLGSEPLFSAAAVSPFSSLVQPLAVRLCNGYIQDMLRQPSHLPYYDPTAYKPLNLQPLDLKTSPVQASGPQSSPVNTSPKKPESREDRAKELPETDEMVKVEVEEKEEKKPTLAPSGKGSRKSHGFQDGVTVGYTYDAFFISDGRSRKRKELGLPERQERPKYRCNECGKQYATSSNLSRHKQTHRSLDSQQAKKCPHCSKVYVSMPALSMHILTHSLKHECTVCNKSFSRPWLLQGHMRSHTGEKPYGCAHCGKAFADRSNLRAHMQTHSAFKHYECKRCHKTFALKSYLNKHYESSCLKDEGMLSPSTTDSWSSETHRPSSVLTTSSSISPVSC